ncbi:very short patch repair endonuclease [Kibdelosporangium aridum]|uniref:very short patch repair endonuclease n=1 Tax=Kibdelosporangium aridum TaxID=2030 RepID=UPI001F411488|nr:very short patch repair endonuclease [Kibdelosporangium aridum]
MKLRGVVLRDRDTDVQLDAADWRVIRVWEHEDPNDAADRIHRLVLERTDSPASPPPHWSGTT